jgi:hypothetical protein
MKKERKYREFLIRYFDAGPIFYFAGISILLVFGIIFHFSKIEATKHICETGLIFSGIGEFYTYRLTTKKSFPPVFSIVGIYQSQYYSISYSIILMLIHSLIVVLMFRLMRKD